MAWPLPPPPVNPAGRAFSPTHFNAILNASTGVAHAAQVHAQLLHRGLAGIPFLLNNLLHLYAQSAAPAAAVALLAAAPNPSVITYTSLIHHFARSRLPGPAFSLLSQMRAAGIPPNPYSVSAVLPACSGPGAAAQLHALALKADIVHDVFVGTALVDAYAKSEQVGDAGQLFDEMPERNLVSWNALIVGLGLNRFFELAGNVFRRLVNESEIVPDQVSVSSVLSACAGDGAVGFGRQVHALAAKLGLTSLLYVINSLADMYAKCGCFDDSMAVFSGAAEKDAVTWNVVMTGWFQRDQFEEAYACFWAMKKAGVLPDESTFSSALHASASLAALEQGAVVHGIAVRAGCVGHVMVRCALIVMYSKCGTLSDAALVFDEIVQPNVVCCTSMIAAYQEHGHGGQAVKLFDQMVAAGMTPDYITFVCVLAACSHNGMVEEGFRYFNSMTEIHGMQPGPEHHACMVDLLARAGRLEEARRFIETIPFEPGPSVWGSLLSSCKTLQDFPLAEEAAEKLFTLEPGKSGNYVLLRNLYTQHGKLEKVKVLRERMGLIRAKKEPGCSWIDVKRTTFVFTAHDKSHARTIEIYEMLGKIKELVKQKGYVADTQFAVNDVGEYKEEGLWHHSERLALAFGLISLPAQAPIRIKKNLRTCGDCHTVMKLVSDIFQRDIVVRDINRFHRFVGGTCSCKDYW